MKIVFLDEGWIDSDIYGALVSRKILDAKHMKRALEAHMVTLQTVFDLYVEQVMLVYPDLLEPCKQSSKSISDCCVDGSELSLIVEHENSYKSMDECDVFHRMELFNRSKDNIPNFVFIITYMKLVLTIFNFIRASRNCDWNLHLASLNDLTKYFFALDKQKYARLVPVYLSEMQNLQNIDINVYNEFMSGNFSVNKNSVPFTAIGVDHALEHINRLMKVQGGIVGITLKQNARARFF